MANPLNIAAYGEGIMYTPTLQQNMTAIQQAGWTSIILSLFHVSSAGDISFNDKPVIQNGAYVGDPAWPAQVAQLQQGGSTITQTLASIGGGGVHDYQHIMGIYTGHNNTFQGTPLQQNFQAFYKTFPSVTLIDMDCEETYDQTSFTAFCEMLIAIGFGITFCPYATGEMSFWTGSLAALEQTNPGAVKWWNLQCYDGGNGNDPDTWASAIQQAIPNFNTNGFILASDWSRFWNTQYSRWQGDCPAAVTTLLSGFKSEASVGGAFIWTIDQIIDYPGILKQHPDPASCGNVGMTDYVAAIKTGL